jgi:hypothetical protein
MEGVKIKLKCELQKLSLLGSDLKQPPSPDPITLEHSVTFWLSSKCQTECAKVVIRDGIT